MGLALAACSGTSSPGPAAGPATTVAQGARGASDTLALGTLPLGTAPPAPPSPTAASTTAAPPTTAAPTTTAATAPVAPLTGLAPTDPALFTRPALVVKIDGHPDARPQVGLDQADVVIEEVVEGISRFMAIFQSRVPALVGPVRSARTQDALIVPMLDRPLFAWSGGNRLVTQVIRQSPVVDLSAQLPSSAAGQWYRATDRVKPHNLMAHGAGLFSLAPPGATAPQPLFRYRLPGDPLTGTPVDGVKVELASSHVEWAWAPGQSRWVRTENGVRHTTADGTTITAANVVVLEVDYQPSPADAHSPEAQTMGTGKVLVFTGGELVEGTWTRTDPARPWQLLDGAGRPILLTPGTTWVELAKPGRAAVVGAGVDPAKVPFPAP